MARKIKKVSIVSPSSIVNPDLVRGAAALMTRWGLDVTLLPHALGPVDGTYAASLEHRLADLQTAMDDEETDLIFCARGGYGAVQLIPRLDTQRLRRNPKPILGFSDITALHALWMHLGIPSIHSSMSKLLAEHADDPNPSLIAEKRIILGARDFRYETPPHPLDNCGECSGRLVGGNWAVLGGLCGTRYDILAAYPDEPLILFLEDISEPIYRTDRLLHQLLLSPHFHRVKGLVFCKFTNYTPNANFPDMESMLSCRLRQFGIDLPYCFRFPIGHDVENLPVVEGSPVTLKITKTGILLEAKASPNPLGASPNPLPQEGA